MRGARLSEAPDRVKAGLRRPRPAGIHRAMGRLDGRVEADLATFVADVRAALGERLVGIALYGSAAGNDWVAGRSDVNTAIVVSRVALDVLEALARVVPRWRARGFALPLVVDREYLTRARDVFPMELDDIARQHRLLAGEDVFATPPPSRAALRHECEYEARAKLLRLRTLFIAEGGAADAVGALMLDSEKSFLVLLRHLLQLRGTPTGPGYAATLDAGERLLGPLPTMRRLLAHRTREAPLAPDALRAAFGAYLDEVERIVAAIDALDA